MKSGRAVIVGLNRHTSSSLRFLDAPFLMKGVTQLNDIHLHKVVVSSGEIWLLALSLGQVSGLERKNKISDELVIEFKKCAKMKESKRKGCPELW